MALNCSELLYDIVGADCNNEAHVLTSGELILIPYDKFIGSTAATANGGGFLLSDGIGTMREGKASMLTTYGEATTGSFEAVKGTYLTKFKHQVEAKLFLRYGEVRGALNALKNGKFVVVLALSAKEAAEGMTGVTPLCAELYGFNSGLELAELSGSTQLEDGVAYSVVLASKDGNEEPFVPIALEGEIEEYEAMKKSLLTPVKPGE